jgi:hypothetical protein
MMDENELRWRLENKGKASNFVMNVEQQNKRVTLSPEAQVLCDTLTSPLMGGKEEKGKTGLACCDATKRAESKLE